MSKLSPAVLFSLKGHVALVSGGATGIGLMMAEALSQSGAVVYIGGRRLELLQKAADKYGPEAKEAGGSLIPIQLDVTDKESITAAINKIKQEHGYLTLLCNNAGVISGLADMKNHGKDVEAFAADMFAADKDGWQKMHDANINSIFFVSAAALPLLVAGRKKFESSAKPMPCSIINVSSVGGLLKSSFGAFGYQAGKAAVAHLSRIQAKMFGDESIKIRVNAICPGWFPSGMTTNQIDDGNKSKIETTDPRVKGTFTGRAGTEEDMAQLCLSLAVNNFVTGEVIGIDGGSQMISP